MNFIEDNEINIPYFLLNSLRKISRNVQRKIQFIENTMYHHGLVKILVEFHLKNMGDNWESSLVRYHFKEDNQEQPSSGKAKTGRKRKIEEPVEQEQSRNNKTKRGRKRKTEEPVEQGQQ